MASRATAGQVDGFYVRWKREMRGVSAGLAELLKSMCEDPRPGYSEPALAAVDALHSGVLAGVRWTSDRFLISLRAWRTRPTAPVSGAHFECIERRHPPRHEDDLVGWIVVDDSWGGGQVVLVHEISHFLNRWIAHKLRATCAPVVAALEGEAPEKVALVRSRLLGEIAARHLAYLAEQGVDPLRGGLPSPGAFFGCAVKIASFPQVYQDPGVTGPLQQNPDLLWDQVGAWVEGLREFRFFHPRSARDRAHREWLEEEIRVASLGRDAPRVPLEGTL